MSLPSSPTSAPEQKLRAAEPLFWENPGWKPAPACFEGLDLEWADVIDAEKRLERFAPLLAACFPELEPSGGIIESPLLPAPKLRAWLETSEGLERLGPVFVKADHALPVAGSIKARGGIYAVLHFAEKIAMEAGLLDPGDSYSRLLEPPCRKLFAQFELSVGSTGNLGLSIGIMGSALGFRVSVHMSKEAKEWKKERLRKRGVHVVEYSSDYTAACVEARQIARANPRIHFIDDENSIELFLGYAVALIRLKKQFLEAGIRADAEHPVFFHLPCGVGGGPGGIAFAARHAFGDAARCFFIEPVQAPCFLAGLLTRRHSEISIYDFGLTLQTEADGLAVSKPSRFVGLLMEPLLDGCVTLRDADMFRYLLAMYETEGLEVEPSSASACGGPKMLLGTNEGRRFLDRHRLSSAAADASHILWTTGGLFVPPSQHAAYRASASKLGLRPL